ncbi:MAG: hypothetical protein WCI78_03370 [Mycobacterium sp.]
MNDDLHTQLAAAIEHYLTILADHGFIVDAECDPAIKGPLHGVYVILYYAIQTIDPDFPRVEKLPSTLGAGETLERLEEQLVDFTAVLEGICDNYQASTGVDPLRETEDPTGGRVAVALASTDIAIELLGAQDAACGPGSTAAAKSAFEKLKAEGDTAAIERHLATRLAGRA